jgi:type I restriction enzyme S subunit
VFIDGDWVESVDQDPNGDVRLIQLADVGDGVYRDRSERFLTRAKAKELGCTFLERGDVLIARMPDPLGRACIFPGDDKAAVTVVDVCIVRTGKGGADHRWLMHFINAPEFRMSVAGLQSGSTRKRISRGNLATLSLPVPPLDEQQRIVAEIDKQFTRLDAGVASLKRVQAALKRYRASVLKAACEGRLVPTEAELARRESRPYEPATTLLARILNERRAAYAVGRKGRVFTQEDADGLSALPEGWTWAGMRQIGEVQLGRQRAPQHHNGDHMRPYLRVANVFEARIDLKDVNTMNFTPEEFEKYRLLHGDILLNEGQTPELVGRPAMFREEIADCCYQKTLLRFRAYTGLLPTFALTVFRSYMHNGRFTRSASITTNIAHLTAEKFVEIEFPLPPHAEQHRIVAEVERRLSLIEELEAVVAANLQRATRLRQSVLHRAFSGKLVSTDETPTVRSLPVEGNELMLSLEFAEASEPEPRWQEPLPKHWDRTEIFAFAEREAVRMGYKPGADLWPIIHREGGRIIKGDPEALGDTGMIFVRGPKKFTVTLSPHSGRQRQRFTLAHELGHYLLHADRGRRAIKICRKGTGPLESEAHWFASAFLIPEKLLRQKIREGLGSAQLAEFFGVSVKVVDIRKEGLR